MTRRTPSSPPSPLPPSTGDEPDALLERLAQFWGAALNSPMPLVQALFMAPPSGDHRAKLCRFLLHRLYHPLAVDPQAPATLLVAAVALQVTRQTFIVR